MMSSGVALALCVLSCGVLVAHASEPCLLTEGTNTGRVITSAICEDQCTNVTGTVVCTAQICTKFMTLYSPPRPVGNMGLSSANVATYTVGFCNGSTDFDCREHLVDAFNPCDLEAADEACPNVNHTCRGGYFFEDPNGRFIGNYALCADYTMIPFLSSNYVLCGHVEFMTPEQRAALAAEEAAEAAEGGAAGGAVDPGET